MRRVWRITKERYRGTAFQGEGARIYGGRWNSPGNPTVYTSGSTALATLELLVHLEDTQALDNYILIPADIEDELLATLDADDLPANWRRYPAPGSTQEIGDEWLEGSTSVGLVVPSVVVPGDNVLLNPHHPDFDEVEIGAPIDWDFDPRL